MEKTDNQKAAEFECRVRKLAREVLVGWCSSGEKMFLNEAARNAFEVAEVFERLAEERWEKLP